MLAPRVRAIENQKGRETKKPASEWEGARSPTLIYKLEPQLALRGTLRDETSTARSRVGGSSVMQSKWKNQI